MPDSLQNLDVVLLITWSSSRRETILFLIIIMILMNILNEALYCVLWVREAVALF